MSKIKPIPLDLLIDSAVYIFTERDRWQGKSVKRIGLENVLIQGKSAIKRSQQSESDSYELLLFFDIIHSRPADFIFSVDDLVEVDGKEYRISQVEAAKSFDGVHHYEVFLS